MGVETASVQSMPEGLTLLIVCTIKTSAVRENCGEKKNDSPNKTRRKKRKTVWTRVEQENPNAHILAGKITVSSVVFLSTRF